ncbi:hypothetical protein HRR83_003730 [Exophiala dermatitidis]|uniref:Cytochrome b561 domain-containing protein n=2 Tax=Exophiala dermatitidis TaxID=5970 RepID=H6BP70_EXODN|nr:uncharacterized protein HMPREF1120_01714 [Exophiala dermatitidis NIH/UT8656]KAJ4518967.1 hypothetical protein HRR75_002643 [Exophiala dermatitidis]EHY53525.1 hypothetical protein HMPREF1120_01714 [Exophiala dermatitidis NIH/UT8656]KAJ4522305.1 hypothetical protein HRR74_002888 [Exophiala dermatitidis]KAJ4529630.1 hypothetical protein HRR73_000656 [Exophiala dermatitidis]KAJ4543206.1 hypothetical protein HRR77_005463 [Exophiala dermatitidis]
MASATGVPEQNPALQEEEPLLGRPGDVTQRPGQGLQFNLIKGTAILAQAGIVILTALVWAAVFQADLIFFSFHPLLNSLALLLLVQGVLVLQPTALQKDKINGTYTHAVFNGLAVAALIAGLVIIEMNKASHPETRFQSVHGKMGLVAYILIFLQWLVGFTSFFAPELVYRSVDRAKSIYKYHRIAGYTILTFLLAVVAAATTTPYNVHVLHIKLWAVLVAAVFVLLGVIPRIKKHKLGF